MEGLSKTVLPGPHMVAGKLRHYCGQVSHLQLPGFQTAPAEHSSRLDNRSTLRQVGGCRQGAADQERRQSEMREGEGDEAMAFSG